MSRKQKSGARVSGDPRKRKAARERAVQGKIDKKHPDPGSFIETPDEYLDKADALAEEFCEAYSGWKDREWSISSQILRAFDSYVMWEKEAEETEHLLDIRKCLEINNVTDIADDVCEFLATRYGVKELER